MTYSYSIVKHLEVIFDLALAFSFTHLVNDKDDSQLKCNILM